MNTDDRLICNRIMEAAENCYNRDIPVETDFLDLHKQTLFCSIIKDLPPVSYKVMGGYDLAERKVIQFLPYEEYPAILPYTVLKIAPVQAKFSEKLTHRDYLGAILNLGIVRDKLGDIVINNDSVLLFCTNKIADFLVQNIVKIRNTYVSAEIIDAEDFEYIPAYEEIRGTVASIRLDAVIALGFNSSRSRIISYIEEGKVAVNGRIITSNAYSIKENDVISVRGLGKIRYINTISETKKGRIFVLIHKYI